ncbi:MAG: SDR family NAD(P)-dependent oxidoreductase [Deltaproteobacteria bacterium]
MLNNKVAIITGGTGALGKGVLSVFLELGANVFSTYRSDKELAECADLKEKHGDRVQFFKADVTSAADVSQLVTKTLETFSRIDALVNIVGGFSQAPISETDEEAWDKMMNLNLKTAFLCSKAVLSRMMESGGGRIVNIASRPALKGSAGMGAYGASKAGVLNLTQSMADELREHNINVNAIVPGTIDTPANRKSMPDADHSKWVAPEDIGRVIAFLCSDGARAVSGAAVPVYGRS